MSDLQITKLDAPYQYAVRTDGRHLGFVTVCRCTTRSQFYQIALADGQVLREFPSVRKAAQAALSKLGA